MILECFQTIIEKLKDAVLKVYGEKLVSLVIFGSVGRHTPRPDSDIDILIIAESLPRGRLKRMANFENVENLLAPLLKEMQDKGIHTCLAPVIKEKNEVLQGSLLFLDMLEDAQIIYDRDSFFKNYLRTLQERLELLGAKKIYQGGAWYWVLKKDYRTGEEFHL